MFNNLKWDVWGISVCFGNLWNVFQKYDQSLLIPVVFNHFDSIIKKNMVRFCCLIYFDLIFFGNTIVLYIEVITFSTSIMLRLTSRACNSVLTGHCFLVRMLWHEFHTFSLHLHFMTCFIITQSARVIIRYCTLLPWGDTCSVPSE